MDPLSGRCGWVGRDVDLIEHNGGGSVSGEIVEADEVRARHARCARWIGHAFFNRPIIKIVCSDYLKNIDHARSISDTRLSADEAHRWA